MSVLSSLHILDAHDATPWVVLLLVRATAILLSGAAAVALLRRSSASARHAALALTVAALLILPLLSGVLPGWDLAVLPPGPPEVSAQAVASPSFGESRGAEAPGPGPGKAGAGAAAPVERSSRARSGASPRSSSPLTAILPADDAPTAVRSLRAKGETLSSGLGGGPVLAWLALVWAVGAAIGAVQIGWAALLAQRTLGRAAETVETDWKRSLGEASRALDLRRPVRLLTSDAVRVPVVHGFHEPTILLPTTSAPWPEDRRRAILLHELAHIRRQDWLMQMLGHLARALYWPHPLAWWMVRRLRAEAERACDDCVLVAGTPAPDYADHLLQAARDLERAPRPFAVLAVVERSRFEDRLLALLDPRLSRRALDRRTLGFAAVMASTLAAGVAVLQPVARALPEMPEHRIPDDRAATLERAQRDQPLAQVADTGSRLMPPRLGPARGGAGPAGSLVQTGEPTADRGQAPTPPLSPVARGQADPSVVSMDAASATPTMATVPDEVEVASAWPAASSAAAPATAKSVPVIRISTGLVQIDAVVTDKQGRHVLDLRPEDFEVFEDGRRQTVSHLHYVVTGSATGSDASDAGVPTTTSETTEPRTLVFVVDDLGLSLESSVRTRRLLEAFARSGLGPRDRAAIVETSAVWGGVITFTSDPRALSAAAGAIRYRVWSRAGLDGRPTQLDMTSRHSQLAIESLSALKRTVDALRSLPGRKAVILLSEGFTTRVSHDDGRLLRAYTATALDALYGDTSLWSALRSLTDLANRASVVIYAMDPLGLQADSPSGQVTNAGESRADDGQLNGRANPQATSDEWQDRAAARMARQDSLIELAAQTGGLAVTDHNDLAGGLGRILDDHSGYYLIGYAPQPSTFGPRYGRPRFHEVKVEVKRRGMKVRSRKGFYGVTDELVAQDAPPASR